MNVGDTIDILNTDGEKKGLARPLRQTSNVGAIKKETIGMTR